MYPAELTVASDGKAGTAQGSRMGVYLKEDSQQYNSRPVYQLDKGGQYLFYNDYGYWMIGSKASGSTGGITTVQQGLLTPPGTGWKYWNKGWNKDPQLTVSSKLGAVANLDLKPVNLYLYSRCLLIRALIRLSLIHI